MASLTIGTRIERAATRELIGYSRSRDLEKDTRSLCYEDSTARKIVRFELGRPKGHVWMIAFSYTERPTVPELLDRGLPSQNLRSTSIGPFPMKDSSDHERLERWIRHYGHNAQDLDFSDPFNSYFLNSFPLTADDYAVAVATTTQLLSDRILSLRADTAKSEISLPFGTLVVRQELGFVSTHGTVPPYARLVLDEARQGSSSAWLNVSTTAFVPGFYMSGAARESLLTETFDQIARRDRSTLASDGNKHVYLIRGEAHSYVEVSKDYVLYLNRGRTEFLSTISELPEDVWRAVYDGRNRASNPLGVLLARLSEQPTDFDRYRSIAEYCEKQGDTASANLYLGLGYLRAKNMTAIARGKLELAKLANPQCDGLSDAFAELERQSNLPK